MPRITRGTTERAPVSRRPLTPSEALSLAKAAENAARAKGIDPEWVVFFTESTKPSVMSRGRLGVATDSGRVYYDDGTNWVEITPKVHGNELHDPDFADVNLSNVSDDAVLSKVLSSNGQLSLPNQSYVRARLDNGGANFSLPAITWTKLPYDTEEEDVLGEYDPTNYRFTALEDGHYLAVATALFKSSSSGTVIVIWRKNGANYGPYFRSLISGTYLFASATAAIIIPLVAGDYLEVYAYASVDCEIYYGSSYTRLFIQKIS